MNRKGEASPEEKFAKCVGDRVFIKTFDCKDFLAVGNTDGLDVAGRQYGLRKVRCSTRVLKYIRWCPHALPFGEQIIQKCRTAWFSIQVTHGEVLP